jgi:hypothetical protein
LTTIVNAQLLDKAADAVLQAGDLPTSSAGLGSITYRGREIKNREGFMEKSKLIKCLYIN